MIEELVKNLREDESFYYAYQANIAMAFQDEYNRQVGLLASSAHIDEIDIHSISNEAAKNFLNLLISHK
jgi:hypothetical protein